jgi:hypothetical protein
MPKLARIAWIACIVAACGRQPSPPSESASPVSGSGPASGSGAATGPRGSATPATAEPCEITECGPPMRMPNRRCPDGSMGGPTGRCLRQPDGRCAWEVRPCP